MWEALVMGVVQGLTEFIPVSSSAHLTLIPQMLGWQSPLLNSLAFDVALHLGTLAALMLFFWRDILKLIRAFGWSLIQGKPFADADARLAWWIVLGTLPAVAVGVLLSQQAEIMGRRPGWVAIWLMLFGGFMVLAERWGTQKKTLAAMGPWTAFVIGVGQALAVFPGVSRSGATMTTGMGLGFNRADAARFSFLLSLPAVLGAVVFEGRHLLKMTMDQSWGVLAMGVLASGLTGYACIRWLMGYLQSRPLYPFAIYRLLLGLGILGWAWGHSNRFF